MFWDAGKYTKHTWLGKGIYLTPAAYAWCLGRIDVASCSHHKQTRFRRPPLKELRVVGFFSGGGGWHGMFTPAIEQLWLNGLNGTGVKTPLRL